MKLYFQQVVVVVISLFLNGCQKEENMSNGEYIFRTGKNKEGKVLMDLSRSQRPPSACQDCHGRSGGNILNRDESIKYKDLTNPKLHKIPYTDALLERFLDEELKSDGSVANTGVVWSLSASEKADLIAFLKTL